MYQLLIVDDEPYICQGLSRLLEGSGLPIGKIVTAHSGYEALDHIRMEDIDLIVTDIQMGSMNGIELMHQARMIKPWVQAIVISAHETFQYAQMAMRLGAKDYLIKPLNGRQFLDTVRDVLLKTERPAVDHEEVIAGFEDRFRMEEPLPARDAMLQRLLAASPEEAPHVAASLLAQHGIRLEGPYFAVLMLKLDADSEPKLRAFSAADVALVRYAALNIASELLGREWRHVSFYSSDRELGIILQWDERQYADPGVNKLNLLDMLGRSLHHAILKYLGIAAVIGISQILTAVSFLPTLGEQARRSLRLSREYRDHYVFYYGDFAWSASMHEEPTQEELAAQTNLIVERAMAYIMENYAQKGLTLHEVAQRNHVSPNYLSYLYKKQTGYNLWEHVIKLRMEESMRLLQQTDLRRYEIADRVGYESPEHFSKIFKKYFGASPSEFKK